MQPGLLPLYLHRPTHATSITLSPDALEVDCGAGGACGRVARMSRRACPLTAAARRWGLLGIAQGALVSGLAVYGGRDRAWI